MTALGQTEKSGGGNREVGFAFKSGPRQPGLGRSEKCQVQTSRRFTRSPRQRSRAATAVRLGRVPLRS